MKRRFPLLFVIAAFCVAFTSLLMREEASAANPIKLFAPWDAGFKWDTIYGNYFNPPTHNGVDFNGTYDINGNYIGDDVGKPVLASQDGVVTVAGFVTGCGYQVFIHHGANVYTRYCHLQTGSLAVSPGSRVLHGQRLGNNGCTGTCDGDHIHFEVRTGGPDGTPELPTPFDGANMAQGQLFLSHNFQERLEIGYRDGDFTADGWPDVGAYQPDIGRWWVAKNGTNNSFVSQGIWADGWGADAIPGDWRHLTGKFGTAAGTDIAIYQKRAGQWWVANSNAVNQFVSAGTWISSGFGVETASEQYRPFTGDFDGDGKHDVAVYQPNAGKWFVARNTGSSFQPYGAPWLTGWGTESQGTYWQNLVGDFDADGKDDIAVYTPVTGQWFVARSTGSSFQPYGSPWLSAFGVDGSAPGSYVGIVGRFAGGDMRADIGVYLPALGRWFIAQNSGANTFISQGVWLDGWGVETGSQRWRPFAGDFAGNQVFVDDIGVYAATAGRWFIADNTGSSFTQVNGPYGGAWLDAWAVESYPGHYRTH